MRKLNRLTMTLALLIAAVGGAWADEAKVYTEAVAFNSLKAGDVLTDGFSITKNIGDYIKVKGYKKDSGTAETEEYSGLLDACTYPGGVVITVSDYSISGNFTPYADGKDANAWIVSKKEVNGSLTTLYLDGYNYLPAIELKPDDTGKNWTLAEMPASNIELQVEYFAESNLFLSKEALADKASIAVKAGDLGVQFGDDGKSANTVTEGTAMTVTYNGAKKILGMKVAKKVTPPEVGQIIGSDGKNYDANATLPTGVTAVAMIAYVGSETGVEGYTHGLALALTDKASTMNWTNATGASGAAAHTPAAPTPMTSSWMLPSKDQWTKMINAAGSYTALRNGFSGITGASNLQSVSYWSSTGFTSSDAWGYSFGNGGWLPLDKGRAYQVRACLAF